MKLTPVFLDFESYWDKDHTLSKMSPIEYVMSPKTEIISVAIKVGDYPTDVVFGEDKIRHVLNKLDWSNKMAIGHNMSGFDSMILKWRFGIQPAMWGCTAAMARPKYAKTAGVSLKALAKEFGIGAKLDLEATNTKGKYLKDFTPEELDAMSEYNKVDTELCAALFKRLVKGFPKGELVLIHLTTQMLVNPKFVLDKGLLEAALSVERANKHKALLDLAKLIREGQSAIEIEWSDEEAVAEFVRSEMASAPRFAKLLESCGVEVPMKPSPTDPTKQVPALAKTDEGFLKLQDHPNPLVASAARTRLSVKSTILETRLEAFLRAGAACGGKLPVPLKYCGADTTGRWSGEQYNCMTEGHEVLTPVGWVDIKDWTPELPIMQWWPDGSASWDEAAKKVEYDHDGPVAVLDGPFTKGVFTLDHRVPSIRGKRRTVKDYTAGWVAKHSGLDGVPAAGVYVGGPGTFSPDQTRLLVATSAGATVTDTQIRWGFRRQRKIDRIMRLFADCGLTDLVRVYDYRGKSGGHWVAVLLRSRAPSWLRKGFGPWLLGLSRESLDALVDELPHWGGSKHSRTGNTCFYTSQADQAEWVSTALHLSGKPARVGRRADNKLDVYARGTVTTSATGRLSTFKGRVYCPQVASGYVFVRYAGSIHVTGNCQNLPRIGSKPKTSDALRNSLKAPKGHKVVVADLSGIELRVNHFLWKVQSSMGLYVEDAEADLYRAFAAARYGVKPEEVTKEQRQLAKVAQLGLGFGAGWRTFKRVAKLMGGLDLSDEDAEAVTTAWRTTYHDIVQGWRRCHDALPDILQGTSKLIDPWGMCETELGAIRLPSGRRIYYPALRTEVDTDGKKEWWYGAGRHRARIYAGKITENCLAEGTLVLTDSGWKPIQSVSADDLVHDGVEFVRHAGIVFKSVQGCITLDGVYMTPDHKVLTDDGWQEASQVQRPYRPDIRGVDCAAPGGAHGQVVEVAVSVPVRPADSETGVGRCEGSQARGYAELRLSHKATDFQGQHSARDVKAPGVRCLALYARQVQAAVAQGVQKLRRAWDHGLRAVAGFVRELLGGHGAYVPAWTGLGPGGQRRPVLAGELPVGKQAHQHDEQAQLTARGGCSRTEPEARHQPQHDLLPASARVEPGRPGSHTITEKPVYDIINCGPRHRFVVKGESGPMVVHNCVQALARDVIAGNAIDFWRATRFEPVLMVHDELVYVVPEADAQGALDELQKIMRTPPKWWPELVTWSEGDIADSYGAAK